MNTHDSKGKRTFTEEIEVLGDQLVQQVKELLEEGNVRQLRIRASDGDIVLETPLTFGVVAGGAVALAAPWLAILGALAAFVTHAGWRSCVKSMTRSRRIRRTSRRPARRMIQSIDPAASDTIPLSSR
jgi:hypothetical protein